MAELAELIERNRRDREEMFPSPETQAQQRGYLAQVPVGIARGLGGALAAVPRALSAIPGVRGYTEPIAEGIDAALPLSSGGYLEGGVESATRSLAVGGMAYAGLAATGGLAAPGVAGFLGSNAARLGAATGITFGAGELAESRKRLEGLNEAAMAAGQAPLSTAEIYEIAGTRGLIEGGLEGLGSWFIGKRLLSAIPAEAFKGQLGRLLPGLAGRYARESAIIAAEEVPVEMLQAGSQSAIERGVLGEERTQALEQAGEPVAPPVMTAAGQVAPQALIASALFGGVRVATSGPRPMPNSGTGPQNAAAPGTPTPRPLPFVKPPEASAETLDYGVAQPPQRTADPFPAESLDYSQATTLQPPGPRPSVIPPDTTVGPQYPIETGAMPRATSSTPVPLPFVSSSASSATPATPAVPNGASPSISVDAIIERYAQRTLDMYQALRLLKQHGIPDVDALEQIKKVDASIANAPSPEPAVSPASPSIESAPPAPTPTAPVATDVPTVQQMFDPTPGEAGLEEARIAVRTTLSTSPEWVQEDAAVGLWQARNRGIVGDIEAAAAQGLTAGAVAKQLQNEGKAGPFNQGDLRRIIRQTRAALGIPSQDEPADFLAWQQQYQARQTPPSVVPGELTPPIPQDAAPSAPTAAPQPGEIRMVAPQDVTIDAATTRIAGGENATKVRTELYAQLATDLPAALRGGAGGSAEQLSPDVGADAGVPDGAATTNTTTTPDEPNLFGAVPGATPGNPGAIVADVPPALPLEDAAVPATVAEPELGAEAPVRSAADNVGVSSPSAPIMPRGKTRKPREAIPGVKPPTKKAPTGALSNAELAQYFTPGAIVPSYAGQDRVETFEQRGTANWRVQVQAVDAQGNPVPNESLRWHQTAPDRRAFTREMAQREQSPGQLQVQGNASAVHGPVSQADILRHLTQRFPGKDIYPIGTDMVGVEITKGHALLVSTVERLTPDEGLVEATYGPEYAEKFASGEKFAAGVFDQHPEVPIGNGKLLLTIRASRKSTDILLTMDHEIEHMAEFLGLVSPADQALMDKTIDRRGGMPDFPPGPEARAQYIAEQINTPRSILMQTAVGRVILRIQRFIDGLARAIGIRTTGQIVREFRSGAIFQREGSGATEDGQLNNATRQGRLQGGDTPLTPLETQALQTFGVTDVPTEASFLLKAGQWLGFPEDLAGMPAAEDHPSAVARLGVPLEDFIRQTGAIRWGMYSNALILEMSGPITEAQRRVILKTAPEVSEVFIDQNNSQTGALMASRRFEMPGQQQALRQFLVPQLGRLQVVNAPAQPSLPGIAATTAVPSAVAPAAPNAIPRPSPVGVQTTAIPVDHYAFVNKIMTPQELTDAQARMEQGLVPRVRREQMPDQVAQSAGEAQVQSWRERPRDLQRRMEEVHAGKNAFTEQEFVGLSLMADEEHTFSHVLHDQAIMTDERFQEVQDAWTAPNGFMQYASMALSTGARITRLGRYVGEWMGGAHAYAAAMKAIDEKLNAIPQDQRDAFRQKLLDAFKAKDYNTLRELASQIPNSTLRERFFEFYYGSILSGFGTQSVNAFSTTASQLFHNSIIRPLAGMADALTAGITGRERRIFASEMLPALLTEFKGMSDVYKHAWWMWTGDPRKQQLLPFFRQETGVGGMEQGTASGAWARASYLEDHAALGKTAGEPIVWMRKLAPLVTAASRLMAGLDVGMSLNAFDQEVAARARRESLRQGIPRDQRDAFEADYQQTFLSKHPPGVGDKLFEEVSQVMKQQVFHDGTGILARTLGGLHSIPGIGAFFQLLMPFKSTPDALLRRGLELLPGTPLVNGWYAKNVSWKWGGWLPMVGKEAMNDEAMFMLARQAAGTLMVASLYALWHAGRISGPPPEDPAEREAQQRAGIVPYSIKLGDSWYSWRRFEPMSLPLGIITSVFDAKKRREERMEKRGEVPVGEVYDSLALSAVAVQAGIKYIMDASYFSGLANFIEGTTQGQQSGTGDIPRGLMRQIVSATTPWVGFQRSLINALDASGAVPGTTAGQVMVRQPQGLGETYAGSLFPFALMEGIGAKPRLSVFGQPLTRQTSTLGELSPVTPPVQRGFNPPDALEDTLRRLKYYPGQPAKTDAVTGKAISPELYRRLQVIRGPIVQAKLEQLVEHTNFDRLDPIDAKKMLQNAVSNATKQAKAQLARETR